MISVTSKSVILEVLPSEPAAEEYRIEYSDAKDSFYQEGQRILHGAQRSYNVMQGGLKPGTRYTFIVVPYTQGVRGKESPPLVITTGKELLSYILVIHLF